MCGLGDPCWWFLGDRLPFAVICISSKKTRVSTALGDPRISFEDVRSNQRALRRLQAECDAVLDPRTFVKNGHVQVYKTRFLGKGVVCSDSHIGVYLLFRLQISGSGVLDFKNEATNLYFKQAYQTYPNIIASWGFAISLNKLRPRRLCLPQHKPPLRPGRAFKFRCSWVNPEGLIFQSSDVLVFPWFWSCCQSLTLACQTEDGKEMRKTKNKPAVEMKLAQMMSWKLHMDLHNMWHLSFLQCAIFLWPVLYIPCFFVFFACFPAFPYWPGPPCFVPKKVDSLLDGIDFSCTVSRAKFEVRVPGGLVGYLDITEICWISYALVQISGFSNIHVEIQGGQAFLLGFGL